MFAVSRRRFFRAAFLAGVLAPVMGTTVSVCAAAAAVDASTPEGLVQTLSADVLKGIREDSAIHAGNIDRLKKLIDDRILPYVDTQRTTRLVVGRAWRRATPAQRTTLVAQFSTLLVYTYAGALSKVTDQQVKMLPMREQPYPDDAVVHTQIVSSTSDPIDLSYRLEKIDGAWKIYDLNIMGIWLVQTYKDQFTEIVNRNGVDGLIRVLTDKNRQLAGGGKAA